MWECQDQEGPLDSKGPQYVLKASFVIRAFQTVNAAVSYWASAFYVLLFLFLLKGEPGEQGERGPRGERGSEVS